VKNSLISLLWKTRQSLHESLYLHEELPKAFKDCTSTHDGPIRNKDVRQCSTTIGFAALPADNRWVVSHNLRLLFKFKTHINVEICSTFRSSNISLNTSTSRAVFSVASVLRTRKLKLKHRILLQQDHKHPPFQLMLWARKSSIQKRNEIAESSDDTSRFGSFFGAFKSHSAKPNIIQLQVHLPEEQNLSFNNMQIRGLLEAPQLTEWSKMNKQERLSYSKCNSNLESCLFSAQSTDFRSLSDFLATCFGFIVLHQSCSYRRHQLLSCTSILVSFLSSHYGRYLIIRVYPVCANSDLHTVFSLRCVQVSTWVLQSTTLILFDYL
jgi:hypothetical protein